MPEFLAASLLSSAEYSYRKISEYSNGLEFPQIANTRIRKCNSSSSFIFSAVVAVHTDNIIAFPSTLIFPVWSICGNILFYLRWGTTYVLKVFLKLFQTDGLEPGLLRAGNTLYYKIQLLEYPCMEFLLPGSDVFPSVVHELSYFLHLPPPPIFNPKSSTHFEEQMI